MGDFTYLNGVIVPSKQAVISVNDTGFLFGDGLFETLRVYGGRTFEIEDHLTRLSKGLAALDIRNAPTQGVLYEATIKTIDVNGEGDCVVRLTVTRGADKPYVVVTTRRVAYTEAQYKAGAVCVTVPETRGVLAAYKTLNYLPNRLAKMAADEAGALEAIFVTADGLLTEGSMSSVFVYGKGMLRTPDLSQGILNGITRRVTLKLAKEAGITVAETSVSLQDLDTADEMFITNSTLEIMPVISVDGRSIGSGRPGELAGELRASYKELT